MKRLALLGCLALLLVLGPPADSQYYAGCIGYGDRRVVSWSECGGCQTCGYTGSGCTVCFNEATGMTCYTSGQSCGGVRNQIP